MNETNASPHAKNLSRMQRMSVIAGAGLVAGLIAVGVGGVASAQTVISPDHQPVATALADTNSVAVAFAQVEGDGLGDGEQDQDDLLTPEDDAVFERFDQCLRDAGLDPESEVEPDEAALDAAFEQCDPILEDLSEEVFGEGFEDDFLDDFSPEDQALFEQYDQCLESAGVDFEPDGELDETALDAAFEQCDPILDGLSEAFGAFPDLSDEDQAVYERFEQCLTDGGVDGLFDSEQPDEAAIDALFDNCEPILDELSEEAQALFDCPEDDEHNDEDGDV